MPVTISQDASIVCNRVRPQCMRPQCMEGELPLLMGRGYEHVAQSGAGNDILRFGRVCLYFLS